MNNYSGPAGQPLAQAGAHAPQYGTPAAAVAQVQGLAAQPQGAARAVRPDALPPELRVRIALVTAGVFAGVFWTTAVPAVIVLDFLVRHEGLTGIDLWFFMLTICGLGGPVVAGTLYATGRVRKERGKLVAVRDAQAAASAAIEAASYARGAAGAAEELAMAIPAHGGMKDARERSARAAVEVRDQAILAEDHAGEAETAAAAAVAARRPIAALAARRTAVKASREAVAAAWEARRQYTIAAQAAEEARGMLVKSGG
jgi:hypothetical protein